ncbi:MAG: flavodoxin family protein [Thermoplasmata archaeon]|jgi:multimeric flavodoxin WrbA|nr:flavodoxin family protein [Thermoplasmata archaeon]
MTYPRSDTIKKILILNASKRRKGNSYALEDYIAEKLKGKAEIVQFNIGEKDVKVCLACDGCKRQHTPNCVQKDDYTALIPEMDKCDAMIILSPVHWDQFPAQLKAVLDRTYSFMDFTQPDFSMASRKDKKLAGFFFAGFGPVDVYTQMVETNLKSFSTAGFREYKAHVAGDCNVPGSVMQKEAELKAADAIIDWIL